MSVAKLERGVVAKAITVALDEVIDVITPLFGDEAVARLLDLPADMTLDDYFEAHPGQRDPKRFSGGVGMWMESLAAYAWEGDNANRQHPEDSWGEVHMLGQAVAALGGRVEFDNSHRNFSVFGDVHIGEDRAVDIVRWVVDAYKARARIDWLGGDISIEELAALAKVTEKTLRMAANPKNEGALKITKRGHRTVITVDDAMEWLARRPDFVPTRNPAQELSPELHIGGSATQLANYLAGLGASQPALRDMAIEAGISEAAWDALAAGEFGEQLVTPEPEVLVRFATKAGIDQPNAFARWVLDLHYRVQLGRIESNYRRLVTALGPVNEGGEE